MSEPIQIPSRLNHPSQNPSSKFNWSREAVASQLRPIERLLPLSPEQNGGLSSLERNYAEFYELSGRCDTEAYHQLGFFDAIGFRLACHVFRRQSCKGTVFVFHGYFDHVGLYGKLIECLIGNGYNVVAYDLPGHGLSSGESVSINQFSQYTLVLESCLKMFKDVLPGPWFAVGQSTGCAVMLDYLTKYRFTHEQLPFQHWVMLAPLVRPCNWNLAVWLHRLFGPFLRTWRRKLLPNSHDFDFVRFLREEDPLQVKRVSVKWVGALRSWLPEIEKSQPIHASVTVIQGPGRYDGGLAI